MANATRNKSSGEVRAAYASEIRRAREAISAAIGRTASPLVKWRQRFHFWKLRYFCLNSYLRMVDLDGEIVWVHYWCMSCWASIEVGDRSFSLKNEAPGGHLFANASVDGSPVWLDKGP